MDDDPNSPDSSTSGNQHQDADQQPKRKRITQACDACNKKKVKCDGAKPVCSNCARSSLVCTYSRGAKKRGPRAGYIESLENRLKEMEALLKPLQNVPAVNSAVSGLNSDPMPGHSDGMSPEGDDTLGPHHPCYDSYVTNGACQAPSLSPEVAAELVELFFHYVYPVLPLVHKNTFMRTYTNESPLLLNAMYALSARYSTHPAVRTNPAAMYSSGDVFYVRARELVDNYMDVPSSTTVSALLALAMYAAGSGRGSAAWMYSGMAIRMAQELKLNVEPEFEEAYAASGRLSWLERETRRRLWWCCFVLDRYAGAAADRSMIINEKDCRVYLPFNESLWNSVQSADDEPAGAMGPSDNFQIAVLTSTNTFTPGIPLQNPIGYFILLTKVFGKIVEYSNQFKNYQRTNPNATSNPDADYQLSILDASLRDWFASLPHWMRQIGDQFVYEISSTSASSWHTAYLHIFYHTCVILLHRPKMMAGLRDYPPTVQFSPSFMLCHTSAQEISQIIGKIAVTNPCFHFFTPFVGFCIFQSGLIHVMASQVSTDPGVVSTAQRNVENHVQALQGTAKFWFMAGRLHAVLKNLIESARQAVGQGTGWIPLKEKTDDSMSEDVMEPPPDVMPPVLQPPVGPRGDVSALDYHLLDGGHSGQGDAQFENRGRTPPTSQPPYPGPPPPPTQYQGSFQSYRPPPLYGNTAHQGHPPLRQTHHAMLPTYPQNHSRQLPGTTSQVVQHAGQQSSMKHGSGTAMRMPSDSSSAMTMGTPGGGVSNPVAISPLFPNLENGDRWE
ncbi:hypothetical protein SeMB42_g07511 [Synchytrium endobioticum]|uniref:Zn(2)-C6 fungal-type domain-containing protein n=1 Tax=Synchytrium endobioticum TaxID=286115 RepID=A0A507C0E1_9FUNG|nr:hypothetical protein SeMB42_g07511 [Synchytrium endobioticum]